MLEDRLLRILACPIDKQALLHFPEDEVLYNPRLRRAYRVETGIPVLLADQAEPASGERHQELVERAALGEAEATLGRDVTDLVEPIPSVSGASRGRGGDGSRRPQG
jgi:uncharacterized protein YbaR (Trm112 family)